MISIQLLFTAAGLLYGQHILIPKSYKWTKRLTLSVIAIFSFILSCTGIFLLVLSISDNFRGKLFANICIKQAQTSSPLDEYRCSILDKGNVSGKVIEFGSGPGTNFKCFENSTTTSNNSLISEYVAVEPNEHFHDALKEEKLKRGMDFPMKIVGLRGEEIDLPSTNSEFDVIISTHVLCSVDVPDIVLTNADLALKPGGRFIFFEHVAADYQSSPTMWYFQQIVSPFLFIVANGCKFRNTGEIITNHFKQHNDRYDLDYIHFDAPMPFFMKFLTPHIMGIATKKI